MYISSKKSLEKTLTFRIEIVCISSRRRPSLIDLYNNFYFLKRERNAFVDFFLIILVTKRFGMLESNPGLSSVLLTVIERPPALPCRNLQ